MKCYEKKEGFVDIEKNSYHYQIIGEFKQNSPFLIFLHEGLGSIPQWKDFPERLCRATGMPGFLYERHGYGQSTPPGPERSPDFLHNEAFYILPLLLEKLNLKGSHYVFGHSDGATIALLYASLQPKNLQATVAEAPHVFLEEQSVKGIAKTKEAFQRGSLKGLEKYHTSHTGNVVLSWTSYWLDPSNSDWNMFDELEKIKTPVLFIQGTKDMFGTLQQGVEIRKRTKGSYQSLILEKCGHVPHFEKQVKVLDAITVFFDKNQKF